MPWLDVAKLRGQQAEQLLTIVGLPITTYDVERMNRELEDRSAGLDTTGQMGNLQVRTPYDDPLFLETTADSDVLEAIPQSTLDSPVVSGERERRTDEAERRQALQTQMRDYMANQTYGDDTTGEDLQGFIEPSPNSLIDEYEGFLKP